MTNHEYAVLMYADGLEDGKAHRPPKYDGEPEYAIGYACGEVS